MAKGSGSGSGRGGFVHYFFSDAINFFGRIFYAALCCLCVGPLFLVIGFSFMVNSTQNDRGTYISEYTAAVQNWNANASNAFVNSGAPTWELSTSRSGQLSMTVSTLETSESSSVDTQDPDCSAIPSYKPRFYEKISSCQGSDNCVFPNGNMPISYDLTLKGANILDGSATCRNCVAMEKTHSYSTLSSSSCNSNSGTWKCTQYSHYNRGCLKGLCTVIQPLSKICLKVKQVSGKWTISNDYGGYGCGEYSWDPGHYGGVSAASTTRDVLVELRSQDDPRVQFYKIVGAGSSLSFGMSDAQKRTLGMYFVASGGAFLAVVGFAVSCMMKKSRSSRKRDGYVAAPTGGFHEPTTVIINNQPPQQVVYQQPQYQQQRYQTPQPQYQQPQYQQQRYQTPQPQYQQPNQHQAPAQTQYNTNSMPTARAYRQGQNPQYMAPTVPAYNQNLPQAKAYKQ